ncbi:cupin domain-containing protein [Nocardia terpenica]|uniref:ChrR-like cupin domain-containing protein n=1 Tax=Nocardia terpenica TaxID=455432 RepID=A0A291RNP2_9NOCA|nr:cupin domain-containing protein [Nocardia terpenica]ATL68945.1 hypothetical protein CRH09_24945 [Nocardia terpenica]
MSDHDSIFSPARWEPATRDDGRRVPGVWVKRLLHAPGGDSFTVLRFERNAEHELAGSPDGRILVLEGDIAIPDRAGVTIRHHAGAYCAVPDDGGGVSSPSGCLVLLVTGARLGAPGDGVFDPGGWLESGPGQWFRLLSDDVTFDERVVGLSYFEPGSFSPRHSHRTAHRVLFLDGEADDEIVFPDGTRRTARRAGGDFVDYPYPIEHQCFSRTGCTILFVHEPLDPA